jgi:hypothetical protein
MHVCVYVCIVQTTDCIRDAVWFGRVQIDMSGKGLFGAGTSGGINPGGYYY